MASYGPEWEEKAHDAYRRAGYRCQECGHGHRQLNRHHIVFRGHGGTDDDSNVAVLCFECHSKYHPHLMQRLLRSRLQEHGYTYVDRASQLIAEAHFRCYGQGNAKNVARLLKLAMKTGHLDDIVMRVTSNVRRKVG